MCTWGISNCSLLETLSSLGSQDTTILLLRLPPSCPLFKNWHSLEFCPQSCSPSSTFNLVMSSSSTWDFSAIKSCLTAKFLPVQTLPEVRSYSQSLIRHDQSQKPGSQCRSLLPDGSSVYCLPSNAFLNPRAFPRPPTLCDSHRISCTRDACNRLPTGLLGSHLSSHSSLTPHSLSWISQ